MYSIFGVLRSWRHNSKTFKSWAKKLWYQIGRIPFHRFFNDIIFLAHKTCTATVTVSVKGLSSLGPINRGLPIHSIKKSRNLSLRYTHKTSSYRTSSYKTSSYQTPSYRTSRIQNVQDTKRPGYKTSIYQTSSTGTVTVGPPRTHRWWCRGQASGAWRGRGWGAPALSPPSLSWWCRCPAGWRPPAPSQTARPRAQNQRHSYMLIAQAHIQCWGSVTFLCGSVPLTYGSGSVKQ